MAFLEKDSDYFHYKHMRESLVFRLRNFAFLPPHGQIIASLTLLAFLSPKYWLG